MQLPTLPCDAGGWLRGCPAGIACYGIGEGGGPTGVDLRLLDKPEDFCYTSAATEEVRVRFA
jgi:hypothetical protein